MQQSLDAMKLALRVLTAITERRQPDPEDLFGLRRLVGPGHERTSPDVLACNVIQGALKHRAKVREEGLLTNADRQIALDRLDEHRASHYERLRSETLQATEQAHQILGDARQMMRIGR